MVDKSKLDIENFYLYDNGIHKGLYSVDINKLSKWDIVKLESGTATLLAKVNPKAILDSIKNGEQNGTE